MSVSKMAANTSSCASPCSDLFYIRRLKRRHCKETFRKGIYGWFHEFILGTKDAEMWGFPFVDENGIVKCLSNRFWNTPESLLKRCRCGKKIDLSHEDWYIDENGCTFHPGKPFYDEQAKMELFSCCKIKDPSPGCVHRPYHVSSTRGFWGDFVKTEDKKSPFLTDLPNIFALDCEMVYTTVGMEIVRITVLSVFCDVIYDTFVKPSHPVIDYNTEFSGTDASLLDDVCTDLKQVQTVLLSLFNSSTILVGHGLENDLLCLKLCHQKIVDTSILFPHERGFPYRHPLKHLAKIYLKKSIQQIDCNLKGHDSKEDARTCLELIAREIHYRQTHKIMPKNSYLSKILLSCMPHINIPTTNFAEYIDYTSSFRSEIPLSYKPHTNWANGNSDEVSNRVPSFSSNNSQNCVSLTNLQNGISNGNTNQVPPIPQFPLPPVPLPPLPLPSMVYMNCSWTTSYPGFNVTNSILHPYGYLVPPPPHNSPSWIAGDFLKSLSSL